jgi:enoyl-CoA hydratase/carnithine racemase
MNDLQHFRVETNSNGVTEVILCQPKKLNSMTPLFFEECEKIFKFLDKDDKTNVILIWAEGKKNKIKKKKVKCSLQDLI